MELMSNQFVERIPVILLQEFERPVISRRRMGID